MRYRKVRVFKARMHQRQHAGVGKFGNGDRRLEEEDITVKFSFTDNEKKVDTVIIHMGLEINWKVEW